jgi:hypothetical protein
MSDTTTKTPAKSAIQYGVLFGVLMVLEFMISYVMDIDPITNPTIGWVFNLLNYLFFPILFIYIGCNNYKKANFGFISLSECLKIGVTICVMAALIYGLFSAVFMLIFPDFLNQMIIKMRAVTLRNNPSLTSEQLETSMSMVKKFMNPAFTIPITLVMYAFLGLIHSLIVGVIVKKDKPVSL